MLQSLRQNARRFAKVQLDAWRIFLGHLDVLWLPAALAAMPLPMIGLAQASPMIVACGLCLAVLLYTVIPAVRSMEPAGRSGRGLLVRGRARDLAAPVLWIAGALAILACFALALESLHAGALPGAAAEAPGSSDLLVAWLVSGLAVMIVLTGFIIWHRALQRRFGVSPGREDYPAIEQIDDAARHLGRHAALLVGSIVVSLGQVALLARVLDEAIGWALPSEDGLIATLKMALILPLMFLPPIAFFRALAISDHAVLRAEHD